MSGYSDIYVIKKTRSMKLGMAFLNHFLPDREQSAVEYEIPQYGEETEILFEKAEDLMQHLEEFSEKGHSVYWRNTDENHPNRHAMLFYTEDGYMIFGISTYWGGENQEGEKECLEKMFSFLETNEGYITYECPPEDTYQEFMKMVKV